MIVGSLKGGTMGREEALIITQGFLGPKRPQQADLWLCPWRLSSPPLPPLLPHPFHIT